MSDPSAELRRPVEQVPVTLFDLPCLAVRDEHGTIFISIRDLCAALDISLPAQLRRIRAHTQLQAGLARFRVHTGRGFQEQDFLNLQLAAGWLLMINTSRVDASVRNRLDYLQRHLLDEVWAAFARLTGLPEGPTPAIEDLDDLGKIDRALKLFAELNQRQDMIEQSQDRARGAWRSMQHELRELRMRLAEVEQAIGGRMSRGQRGYLYQLVDAWAEARAAQSPGIRSGAAQKACWREFNAHFKLATYTDLQAAQYAEALIFVKNAYRALTGTDLDLPAQAELGLE